MASQLVAIRELFNNFCLGGYASSLNCWKGNETPRFNPFYKDLTYELVQ